MGNAAGSGASVETRLCALLSSQNVPAIVQFFEGNRACLESTFAPGTPYGGMTPLHVCCKEGLAVVRGVVLSAARPRV
jgi:hypothetical protein